MTQTRSRQLPDDAVSDEAAAYIADLLMDLALQFEATHLAQIRRHDQSIMPEPDDNQLDLFERSARPDRAGRSWFESMTAPTAASKAAAVRR